LSRLSAIEYQALAEFRHRLERFLQRRRRAARDTRLQPRQYELMLAVKGMPKGRRANVRDLAERLQIKHHTVVGLVDRLEERGFIQRQRDHSDRRIVHLGLTSAGEALLRKVVSSSLAELRTEAPALVEALTAALRGV
jgi:DNA-binding MarR family transcriptional regulator